MKGIFLECHTQEYPLKSEASLYSMAISSKGLTHPKSRPVIIAALVSSKGGTVTPAGHERRFCWRSSNPCNHVGVPRQPLHQLPGSRVPEHGSATVLVGGDHEILVEREADLQPVFLSRLRRPPGKGATYPLRSGDNVPQLPACWGCQGQGDLTCAQLPNPDHSVLSSG